MELRKLEIRLDIEGAGSDAWHLEGVIVRERLDAPMSAELSAKHTEAVDVDALIGKPATITIIAKEGDERFFHGVVSQASIEARREDAFELEIEVVSKLAILGLGKDSRIFQDQSIVDVVTKVFETASLDMLDVRTGSHPPHHNIVQYDESDLDFVLRLLAEEGIGLAIRNDEAGETAILFDDDGGFAAIDGETTLIHRSGSLLDVATVIDASDARRASPDRVALRDYDFTHPATDLTFSEAAPESRKQEVYAHPGGFEVADAGKTRAKLELERLVVQNHVLGGKSDVPHLEPGRSFTLGTHAREALTGEVVVIEVEHRALAFGSAESEEVVSYENVFVAIPVGVPYRPRARAAAPRAALSTQPAFVTCPGGEEIHADEHGRVNVRFPWDRSGITDDKSSTFLRVGQLALSGSMVLPRGGFEVLVTAELGDLDRPAVAAHLYNKESPPPYALPGGATISSVQSATTGGGPGANEMRFEDAAGKEEIFLNASKDYVTSVDHDAAYAIGNDERVDIGGDRTCIVMGSMAAQVVGVRTLDVGGSQSINTTSDLADGIGTDLSITVGAARMVKVGGDQSESVGGDLSRTVGAMESITALAGYARTVKGNAKLVVGGAQCEASAKSRAVTVGGKFIETIGAVKMLKAKGFSVTCSNAYTAQGAVEKVKTGKGRTDDAKGAVTITAGSAMKIKSADATFSAENKLTIKAGGCTITLDKSGEVTIKAPNITLKNVNALNQLQHKSN